MEAISHPLNGGSKASRTLLGDEGEGGAFDFEVDSSLEKEGFGTMLLMKSTASQETVFFFRRGVAVKVNRDAETVDFAGGRCGVFLKGF